MRALPLDPAGFDAFAASICFPDVSAALVGTSPVDDPVSSGSGQGASPLAFPGVPGRHTTKVRMVNTLVGMADRPEGLVRPHRALRVL